MVKSIILESILDHVGVLSDVATDSFGAFQVGSNRAGNDFIESQDGRSQCFFYKNKSRKRGNNTQVNNMKSKDIDSFFSFLRLLVVSVVEHRNFRCRSVSSVMWPSVLTQSHSSRQQSQSQPAPSSSSSVSINECNEPLGRRRRGGVFTADLTECSRDKPLPIFSSFYWRTVTRNVRNKNTIFSLLRFNHCTQKKETE